MALSAFRRVSSRRYLKYCQENQITAIIPTRDADVAFYAQYSNIFSHHGIHLMVSPTQTVSVCLDKKAFAEILLKNRFPAIPAYLSLEEFESSFYVVKERWGPALSNWVWVLHDNKQ